MDFDSLASKYRSISFKKRMILLLVLGALPALNSLVEEGDALNSRLERLESEKRSAEVKFKKARDRKVNLPKLEEQLSYTQGELTKASNKLPDEFFMEKILEKTAMIAQDVGVQLNNFDPGKETPEGGVFKYVKLPIYLNVTGTYTQLAAFFDKVVHLDLLVHIRNLTLDLHKEKDKNNSDEKKGVKEKDKSNEDQQKRARSQLRLLAVADMVVFRTMTSVEEAAISSINKGLKKKKRRKKK